MIACCCNLLSGYAGQKFEGERKSEHIEYILRIKFKINLWYLLEYGTYVGAIFLNLHLLQLEMLHLYFRTRIYVIKKKLKLTHTFSLRGSMVLRSFVCIEHPHLAYLFMVILSIIIIYNLQYNVINCLST